MHVVYPERRAGFEHGTGSVRGDDSCAGVAVSALTGERQFMGRVRPDLGRASVDVWAVIYELDPGERVTVTSVYKSVQAAFERKAAWRAISEAEQAGLVRLMDRERSGKVKTAWVRVWERVALPVPVTIEWAASRGCNPTVAWRVYDSLCREKYLALTAAGFVPRR